MKNCDMEVCLNCDVGQVYVGLALTNTCLWKRRTSSNFGPNCLRPTICAGLVSLAGVKTGDIVLDPMCGGGSIPLEGQAITDQFFLGEHSRNIILHTSISPST